MKNSETNIKDNQLFGIKQNDKYFVTLSENGEFNLGTFEEANRMNVVQLEEWLQIINKYKINYAVFAFSIQNT